MPPVTILGLRIPLIQMQSIKENPEINGCHIEEVVMYEILSRSRKSNLRLARVTFHTQSLPEKVTVVGLGRGEASLVVR